VAIVTFSRYPEIIKKYMEDIVGVDMSKIFLVWGLPANYNKYIHIGLALTHFETQYQINKETTFVALVDDSSANLRNALQGDLITQRGSILAPKIDMGVAPHFDKVVELSESLKNEIAAHAELTESCQNAKK
jgi:hypothetical protein